MPTSFTIPRSIGAAERKLTELGELATATEWQRAAIVAAYVQSGEGQGRRTSVDSDGGLVSATAFAARGIHGLTSATTVNIYARAWLDRFDRPLPGRKVTPPDEPWPPTRTGTDGYATEEGMQRTVDRLIERHGPAPVAKAVAAKAPREAREAIRTQPSSPDAPFEQPPEPYPDASRDTRWIDVERDITALRDYARRVADACRDHPDVMVAERRERVQGIIDLLTTALMEAGEHEAVAR